MAIIKKPIKKTLFYLSSLLGLVLALITGIFLGTSQYNLSQLKNKAESIFGSSNVIPSAKADVPLSGDSGDSGGSTGDSSGDGSSDVGGEGCCFVAGTLILMADNSFQPIEFLIEGSVVMAFDSEGNLSPRKVTRLFVHKDRPVIEVDGIQLTKEHRFVLPDGSWKAIGDLQSGDLIVKADGTVHAIKNKKDISGNKIVYNITVENLHTYIAGGFRVHNIK